MATLLENIQFPPTKTEEARALIPQINLTSTTLLSAANINRYGESMLSSADRAQDDLSVFN